MGIQWAFSIKSKIKFTSTGNCDNGGNYKSIMYMDPLLSALSTMEDIENMVGWVFSGPPGITHRELAVFYSKPAEILQNSSGLY